MKKQLLAFVLVLFLALSLFGCQQDPTPTTQTTTAPTETTLPAPTAPDALTAYGSARALMDAAQEATFDILLTTTMTVADQHFTSLSAQVLTYNAMDTKTPLICLEERVFYDTQAPTLAPLEQEDTDNIALDYKEIFTDGVVYATLENTYSFSGQVPEDNLFARYLPTILLDETLYSTVTSELSGDKVIITFADPTAGEAWAVPAEAELSEASGSATISADGTLEQMYYTATYQYGSVAFTMEATSSPRASAEAIAVPENIDNYPVLQTIDALRSYVHSIRSMQQSTSLTVSNAESVFSQAAGVMRNQSCMLNLFAPEDSLSAKIETDVYLMDYSTYEDQKYNLEESYIDGKYVYKENEGVPTSQTDIPVESIMTYCQNLMLSYMAAPSFWQDAVATDLGSVTLIEYTFNEDFGNNLQNSICITLFDDATLLNNLASAYVANEVSGYLALENTTGLPTAAGCYYKGTHTIEGTDYPLTLQGDQSFTVPSFGAYESITEEKPVEQEPEEKASPLFYHVTGKDGQEMWLLGTIHVGDNRTGFLPQEIYDAFTSSDALALEIDSEAFDKALEEDEKLQETVSAFYYYSDGSTTADHLEETLYETAVKHMKASGNYNMNTPYMKLSAWTTAIENFYLRLGHMLTSEQGVEERLTTLAKEQEKEIREVESNLDQIELLNGWSDELQLVMLEELLEQSMEEYWQNSHELYELWCTGDEAALSETLSDAVDTSEMTDEELAEYNALLPLIEEYNKAMSYDRNDAMLEVAIEYLESGDIVFYAVGLAHLLNDANGLVQALRDAGYTVELVSYA